MSNIRLVCEGSCNPHIRDYDIAAGRTFTNNGEAGLTDRDTRRRVRFVADMARTLKHTEHAEFAKENWSVKLGGWCKKWKCVDCGHIREF